MESLGFKCKGAMPDRNNSRFNVFLFEDTDEFRKALNNYKGYKK